MRKNFLRGTALALAVSLSVLSALPMNAQSASKIKMSKTKLTLVEGKTGTLYLKGISKAKAKKAVWKTSNKKTVTVKFNKKTRKATVKAVKKGTAKITAKVSGKKYTCKVTVNEPVYRVSDVKLNRSWQYADRAVITSGSARLYKLTAKDKKNKTIAINAGHGTEGGTKVKVPCHPDGSPKIVSGSTAAGKTEATAVSEGIVLNDGTKEREATLKTSRIVRDKLLAAGYDVLMIRDGDDVQLDNLARTVIANNCADVHIAIHYDSDGRDTDKGVFFCAVPDVESYKNMVPVKAYWKDHQALGTSCVNGLAKTGMTVFNNGSIDMDLTQTSFSTVPSIDLEVGNQCTKVDDAHTKKVADGVLAGLNSYFKVKEKEISGEFYKTKITDDIWKRIEGKSYKADCTVPLYDLRYIHVLHRDIEGVTHEGEMIVNSYIADDCLEIFRELYDKKYPIEKMRLVDEYDAVDEDSMRDNNSSSFNFRFISHTTRVSKHGLGLAVDINTLYNPYVKDVVNEDGSVEHVLEPATAGEYVDRSKDFDYKINKGDLCYNLFIQHGFEWGGEWTDRKDYQHFEIPTDVIDREGLGIG